ncbi:MAG TPA: sialidase family protein [Pirellulales bacterium]|nr:sialidase family protein [Pirellulales bacterium]
MMMFAVRFCCAAVLLAVATADAAGPSSTLQIEPMPILTGPDAFRFTQSRAAVIPGDRPRVLLTTQATEKGGAHGYRDLYELQSSDGGRTWTEPKVIDNLRREKMPGGDERVIGDVWPQWHAATGVVLATGKTFTFRGGKTEDRSAERVSYTVYDPAQRTWSGLQLLELPTSDHAGQPMIAANAGCNQRYDLPNGEILLPIRYRGPQSHYVTLVARCRFDGAMLTYVEHGSELSVPRGRGLYEPSVVGSGGRYFLTLRADDTAYVARSNDGIRYEPIVEWRYDDGKPLGSYNTQQHWVAHGDRLWLVYTRRGAKNDHILRHRAPLFIAAVDRDRLCVLRATEQVLIPENDASLGNFGVTDFSASETWVITSEEALHRQREQDRNKVLAARVLWPDG